MKKTSLCESCVFGLIREWDCINYNYNPTKEGFAPSTERHFTNKCLKANDYPGIITSCNRYEKVEGKVTYHDPDFNAYEDKLVKDDVMRDHGYEKAEK